MGLSKNSRAYIFGKCAQKNKKLDFVIVNGENAADSGVGITKKNTEDFFNAGADVITSGNHIWDEKETMEFISSEKRFRIFTSFSLIALTRNKLWIVVEIF